MFRKDILANGPNRVTSETLVARIDGAQVAEVLDFNEWDNAVSRGWACSIAPSPDSRHVAYITKADVKDKVVMWLDDRPGDPYKWVGSPVFSRDGRRMAYLALISDKKMCAVIDGIPGPVYQSVDAAVFSGDGRHVAYGVRRDGRACWVIDGRETSWCEDIAGGIAFSDDGRHVAYGVRELGREHVAWNGKRLKDHAFVLSVSLSPDGRRLAYVAGEGKRPPDLQRNLIFVPSEKRQNVFAVVDGIEGQGFGYVHQPQFSSDGKHVAYVGIVKIRASIDVFDSDKAPKSVIVLDGAARTVAAHVGGEILGPQRERLVFSPDGNRLAFRGDARNGHVVGIDEQMFEHDLATVPVFSADSRHVAYAAMDGREGRIILDGRPQRTYVRDVLPVVITAPWLSRLVFSPDGQHLAHRLWSYIVVDDVPGRYKNFLGTPMRIGELIFDSNDRFHYLERRSTRQGTEIYLVEERVP